MKKSNSQTVALNFYKNLFLKYVNELGYDKAVLYMEKWYTSKDDSFLIWNQIGNEVMQWYDFEILGVSNG